MTGAVEVIEYITLNMNLLLSNFIFGFIFIIIFCFVSGMENRKINFGFMVTSLVMNFFIKIIPDYIILRKGYSYQDSIKLYIVTFTISVIVAWVIGINFRNGKIDRFSKKLGAQRTLQSDFFAETILAEYTTVIIKHAYIDKKIYGSVNRIEEETGSRDRFIRITNAVLESDTPLDEDTKGLTFVINIKDIQWIEII